MQGMQEDHPWWCLDGVGATVRRYDGLLVLLGLLNIIIHNTI